MYKKSMFSAVTDYIGMGAILGCVSALMMGSFYLFLLIIVVTWLMLYLFNSLEEAVDRVKEEHNYDRDKKNKPRNNKPNKPKQKSKQNKDKGICKFDKKAVVSNVRRQGYRSYKGSFHSKKR